MYDARSEQRNATAFAISCGLPARRIAVRFTIRSFIAALPMPKASVPMTPGTIALHVIPCRPPSSASVPGVIGTEAFELADAAMNERIVRRTALRRPGEPQEIANVVAFLCSDLAAYVTGVELNVSGGVELFVF